MKNLPGPKIIVFSTLVLAVAIGAYAWTQEKPPPVAHHPMFILKLGWEGKRPNDVECVDIDYNLIKQFFNNDKKRYRIRHFSNGSELEKDADGDLGACPDVACGSDSASEGRPTPEETPKGVRTQTAGAVSLNSPDQLRDFVALIGRRAATPSPKN